ncbi:mannitol dehydrogenase family protein [Niveispirillum sp. KHB5.9]|uniref:mannitol dehydrogenase family protein n=1 Tax=Niveispirillum sp. KHB5.9 TaxID=3400269 RepID=UPI003A89CCDA
MPSLSTANLGLLSADVARPAYDRDAAGIGVVHFGPGAFFRAHQAFFFDEALGQGGNWAICAAALRSTDVRDALRPQDNLYILAELERETRYRVIGAIKETLAGPADRPALLARLANPDTVIVTMTVTEKGYCLKGDGSLDFDHADIAHDVAEPLNPVSLIGHLVEGLRRRHAAGTAPFTVISCDNLVDNGHKLGRAVADLAEKQDGALAAWIREKVAFPRTMVDSITPATDDALRTRVTHDTGVQDAWPIQRERFTQWVIEDKFSNIRPDFASIGVTLTKDVSAYDRAKLRLLNGPHSTLAYLGSLAGYESVAEAMGDADLAGFARRLMLDDISPTLNPDAGIDYPAYIDAILARFANPGIRHLLSQIAWDGSAKLPFRLFGTIAERLAAGAPVDNLALPVAAWMHFVRRKAADGTKLTDPLAESLLTIGRAVTGDAHRDVSCFFTLEQVFPPALRDNPAFRTALERAYALLEGGVKAALKGI